jgi:hypothetical protein
MEDTMNADQARAALLVLLNEATATILDVYPPAERMGWDAKAAEAKAVLAAGNTATLDMAPLLTIECAVEHGPAEPAERLTQLKDRASTVDAKATAWGHLMATLSGIRGRALRDIAAANTDDQRQAALEAARAAISSLG